RGEVMPSDWHNKESGSSGERTYSMTLRAKQHVQLRDPEMMAREIREKSHFSNQGFGPQEQAAASDNNWRNANIPHRMTIYNGADGSSNTFVAPDEKSAAAGDPDTGGRRTTKHVGGALGSKKRSETEGEKKAEGIAFSPDGRRV